MLDGGQREGMGVRGSLHLLHSLLEVGDNVFYILDTDRETYEVWCYACLTQLLVSQLTVCVACRMKHTCTGICHVSHDRYELKVVHELNGILTCTLETEGDNTTRTVREILLAEFIIFV